MQSRRLTPLPIFRHDREETIDENKTKYRPRKMRRLALALKSDDCDHYSVWVKQVCGITVTLFRSASVREIAPLGIFGCSLQTPDRQN